MKNFFRNFKQRSKGNKVALIAVSLFLVINIITFIASIILKDWGGLPTTLLCTLTTGVALASIYISEG